MAKTKTDYSMLDYEENFDVVELIKYVEVVKTLRFCWGFGR